MRILTRRRPVLLSLAAVAAAAAAAVPATASASAHASPVVGHVYVNDNTAGTNTIGAFDRHADGTLTPESRISVRRWWRRNRSGARVSGRGADLTGRPVPDRR